MTKSSHDKCVGVSVKRERERARERNEKSRVILQFVGHVRRQTGYWRDTLKLAVIPLLYIRFYSTFLDSGSRVYSGMFTVDDHSLAT